MRLFQRIVRELKAGALKQTPGEILRPPAILPSILVDDRRLSYAGMGLDHPADRQPVVFIHGFGGFFMDWAKVMAQLARSTRVYAIDLPGWGFSEANPNARGIEDDADAVSGFIQTLGLKNVILCGISYGAGVTWAAAARKIPNVQHAVLLNPMPPRPLVHMHSPVYQGLFSLNTSLSAAVWGHRFLSRQMYEMIVRESLLDGRLPDDFYMELGFRAIKQPGVALLVHVHSKGARDVDWGRWESELRSVRIPVTILQSPEDGLFSMASARHLQGLIPRSRLVEVQGSGHAMVFDQYKKIGEFICTLLEPREMRRASGVD